MSEWSKVCMLMRETVETDLRKSIIDDIARFRKEHENDDGYVKACDDIKSIVEVV